jgi:DNA-binding LacI/PurR family transcriptional regulator
VALVAIGDEDGNLAVRSPRVEEHLRTLERECASARVRLALYTYVPWTDTLYGPGSKPLARHTKILGSEPLGILIWTLGIPPAGLSGFVGLGRNAGLPVALLNEFGPELVPVSLLSHPRSLIISTASDIEAGAQMGRHLRDLGHRSLAFISPVHGAEWSVRRLQGLQRLADTGSPITIETYLLPQTGQSNFVPVPRQEATSEMQRLIRAVIGGGHLSTSYEPQTAHRALERAIEHDAMGAALEPILEQALGKRTATAWIASSDSVALLCLDFLRRHRVAVPEQISVVGFDDGLDAFLNRLTSYNFNGSAAVHAMLSFVVNPPRAPRSARGTQSMALEGFVTVRSTAAAI